MKRRNASDWSDEILITKSDLQEKNSLTSEVKLRIRFWYEGSPMNQNCSANAYRDRVIKFWSAS